MPAGVCIGIVLLLAVAATAFAIGAKAAESVRSFRQEHHEGFTGRDEQ